MGRRGAPFGGIRTPWITWRMFLAPVVRCRCPKNQKNSEIWGVFGGATKGLQFSASRKEALVVASQQGQTIYQTESKNEKGNIDASKKSSPR